MTILDGISPADLDLPPHFPDFRDIQRQMADFALYGVSGDGEDVRRFMAMGAPTGSGKSLAAHAIGKLSGVKYVILTATKALEDQQADEFECVDVRGRSNYECSDRHPMQPAKVWSCEQGPDEDCEWADTNRCTYRAKANEAAAADSFVTNYQYWMHARASNRQALEKPDNPIQLLICDEFHLAMQELGRFLGVWVSNEDLHKHANAEARAAVAAGKGAEAGTVRQPWILALQQAWNNVVHRMAAIEADYQSGAIAARHSKEYRRLSKLERSLARVCQHAEDGNWLWRQTKAGIAFDCVWPKRYAERYLWSGVERVILMSATLRPKALSLLGIDPAASRFKEWPRVFPAHLAPVYWIPTGRMGRKAGEQGLEASVARMDEILDVWGHLKGLVHTPSYHLAEYYARHSRYSRSMILSQPGEQNRAATRFREGRACTLVSPSFSTGWDFPAEEEGSFQIIPKLPFADRSDPVVEARAESDRDHYVYEAAQQLVQASGRRNRRATDSCTTMITDDLVGNFRNYAKPFFPRWYSVRESKTIPVPK
jgi:Rad3-related DNA helicase